MDGRRPMSGEIARARDNRQSAQRCKGPPSTAGNARVSQNARGHGLSPPILADPRFGRRVEPLARLIAGEGGDTRGAKAP